MRSEKERLLEEEARIKKGAEERIAALERETARAMRKVERRAFIRGLGILGPISVAERKKREAAERAKAVADWKLRLDAERERKRRGEGKSLD